MNPHDAIRRLETELNIILGFGYEQRKLVGRVNGIKIEIYPNEHVPPHFHITSPELSATFEVETCDLVKGNADSSTYKKIRDFHSRNRDLIIETWNNLRPTNCKVGPISHRK